MTKTMTWQDTPPMEDNTPTIPAIPEAKPLSALVRPTSNDDRELLKNRFLSRLGTLLLCGPTGVGKSAFIMQLMILWALCRESFGITPARPIKSLLIQSENDDGDLVEMRDGVITGLDLTAAEAKQATDSVIVRNEDERTGLRFIGETVKPLLAAYKSDLLWIDPALAFLGGESNSQKDVGGFLRNWLNPALRQFNCGAVIVHHTNKPSNGKEKPNWQAGDFAYLGAGSAEWANHARAVLALRSIGSRNVFELQAGKRGARLGWRDADGQTAFVKHLAHDKRPGVICWHEASDDDVAKNGRPPKHTALDLLKLLPKSGLTSTEWKDRAAKERGVGKTKFFELKSILEIEKRIAQSPLTDKWLPE
jgi:hypothetical protein